MILSAIRGPVPDSRSSGRGSPRSLERGQCEQNGADQPVDLPRLAEGAGEEAPQRVQADGSDEEQRRPVVDLPDEQAARTSKLMPPGRPAPGIKQHECRVHVA